MYSSQEAKKALRQIEWEEEKIVPIAEGPYRYRIVVHCSSLGRQKAAFANGEYPYFCYIETTTGDGQWIEKGTSLVPVLPDGRFIMVVEQRAPQSRFADRQMIATVSGHPVDLRKFGPYSSLEFPGGSVDQCEGLKAGFLRELQEETCINDQPLLFYMRRWPIYSLGSDEARQQFLGVVFLSDVFFAPRAETDGGLTVLALTRDDVEANIWNGAIHSAQAALTQWCFYKEVEAARQDPAFADKLTQSGYLEIEHIKIARP